jgi:hypothetical protein
VRDEVEALREDPDADEGVAAERWQTVKRLAPGLLDVGGKIVESVATASIKAGLGLP